jgi:hypothetical protein
VPLLLAFLHHADKTAAPSRSPPNTTIQTLYHFVCTPLSYLGEMSVGQRGVDLILTRKLLVDPEEFLAFVHHADETAEARIFGFE